MREQATRVDGRPKRDRHRNRRQPRVYRRPAGEGQGTPERGDTSRAETNMCEVVADMSDDEIEKIAAHYAALPFVPATQEFDAALAAAGEAVHERECARCHTDGGSNPEDEAGILAGQWMGYMKQTFVEYETGAREQPKKMQEKMVNLSVDDVDALIHYYASQQ